ncbi:MAG TPA: LysR family transcriptional regulator [Candidatus Angelobacter sp.]|nr:LysR family transcriptional regulator [Candidatus Angelobacter sp.]
MFEDLFKERGLSLERLHALVQLEGCGSLIKAAGNDKGKQSRYSHYLRELSEFFRVPLTARSGKGIRLTPAGRELATIVKKQFHSLLQFRQSNRKGAHLFRLGAADELLQWLVIPTLGSLRRIDNPFELLLRSLPASDIISKLQSEQLDFGLVPADAVPLNLHRAGVCTLTYAVIVPERLVAQRGYIDLKRALFDCPHAALRADAQSTQRMNKLAESLKGTFRPQLICDSIVQCVTAVKSGYFAAVIPLQFWSTDPQMPCHVVEGGLLNDLSQQISLTWHSRLLDVRGPAAKRIRDMLLTAIRSRGNNQLR